MTSCTNTFSIKTGSQDVAHDKSSLDSYGVTHILNLDSEIENKFEDDYNYKNINIQDKPDFDLDKVFEDCFDFIDDGRHYGNVLVHCSGTIGLSRSTAVCIAYLMSKEKQKFNDAFNNVKEARSFVKPNEGFIKQLKDYEVKLRGAQEIKESGIDDPFALRKKQEIEQEKAMVAGAASVKNRMKMFGATLDTGGNARSKSVSPSPAKMQANTSQSPSPAAKKWGSPSTATNQTPKSSDYGSNKAISKSMTPEPRKSWQNERDSDFRPASNTSTAPTSSGPSMPPPPPPPMPTGSLLDDKAKTSMVKPAANLPPPPPPPPPVGDPMKGSLTSSNRKQSIDSSKSNSTNNSSESINKQRMVFGRVPPPPMKIKGGLSIERQDSTTGNKNTGITQAQSNR